MDAGQLDRRITIKHPVITQSPSGAPVITWENFATVWAKKEDLRDSDRIEAAQLTAKVDTKFTVRWRNDIESTFEIYYRGHAYRIQGMPIEIGRKEFLEIQAERKDNEHEG